MKTDTLFYELFSRWPGVALQLAGHDPSCADAYEFRSGDRRAEDLACATTGPSSNSSKLRLSNSKLGRFACLTPTAWNSFRAANPALTSQCTIVLRTLRAWLQFSKIATVSLAIRAHNGIRETIVHTGQHFNANMSDVFFKQLAIPYGLVSNLITRVNLR